MISMMETMEKRIHLIKNSKKKGMTLVEIMAAIAILSILFMGISQLIVGTVKSEARADRRLESDGYLKNALLMFETGLISPEESLSFTVKFDDIIQMQEGIKNLKNITLGQGTYEILITSNLERNNLYKVNAVFKNLKGEEYSKYMYVIKQ
ncbi:type II secretion system protein J [uncultured Clostridium sp.]|uniref:PulJ/GspJ family protein n=1 Tax=uncultured Clostridium sp. TaxID=59620 RepID=UPI002616F277|nr:type II secretion system protein [uncultured Clostridium sp.]